MQRYNKKLRYARKNENYSKNIKSFWQKIWIFEKKVLSLQKISGVRELANSC